jgi:drug/metabolite transporter (DMT)-like permease
MVIGGVTFGLHFVLFNTGFHHTSYESTVVLMVAQPLTAALLGYIFLREVVTSRMVISIVLGAVGLVILVWQDYTFKPEHLVGDGIVFACVVAIVITYLFARRLRQTLSYPVYVFTLFSVASVTAAVYMVVDGQSLFHTSNGSLGWISIVVLIVWCTFVGHTSFNYVTKYIPLFYTNIVIISEPVIAILLKYALRSRFEVFRASDLGGLHIAGGLILALGILIGFWGKRAASPNHRDTEDAEAAQRDSN